MNSISSFVIFLILLAIFLIWKRKNLSMQKMLFPIFYVLLYRTRLGLDLMKKIGTKYRELVRLFGLACIGFGFFYMVVGFFSIIINNYYVVKLYFKPSFPLLIPGIHVPGYGTLTFGYWIFAIFCIAFVHEFAHGIVAVANNLKIKSTGFGFFSILAPIFPLFFVEPDEKKLQAKPDVVQYSVLAAGSIGNLVLYLVLLLIVGYVLTPIVDSYSVPAGVSFESINEKTPIGEVFENRVILTEFNGANITTYNELMENIKEIKPGDVVSMKVDGENYNVTAAASDEDPEKAYFGMFGITNEVRYENGKLGSVLGWLTGFLRFLSFLTYIVAIINLLPLYLTDGARMLYVFLKKSITDQKKALKVWNIVNIVTVILILISISLPYLIRLLP